MFLLSGEKNRFEALWFSCTVPTSPPGFCYTGLNTLECSVVKLDHAALLQVQPCGFTNCSVHVLYSKATCVDFRTLEQHV